MLLPLFSSSQLATTLWAVARLRAQLPSGFLAAAEGAWELKSAGISGYTARIKAAAVARLRRQQAKKKA